MATKTATKKSPVISGDYLTHDHLRKLYKAGYKVKLSWLDSEIAAQRWLAVALGTNKFTLEILSEGQRRHMIFHKST